MKSIYGLTFGLFLLLLVPVNGYSVALSSGARVSGNLVVDGLHFSADGSTVTSKADLVGPAGPQGATGPTGPQGPAGTSMTTKWLWTKYRITNFIPAMGSNPAYTQVSLIENHYDTDGKSTGWSQTNQNGTYNGSVPGWGIPVSTVAYNTALDAHNNATDFFIVSSNSGFAQNVTATYTYDPNTNTRSQRIRTYYNQDGSVAQTQTTNYDTGHHGAYVSEIRVRGTVTTTTTYTYASYDTSGYPAIATTATTQYDSATGQTYNWTGNAMFEYQPFTH